MRKLHADPEFKERHREAAAERMRKLNADPEFKEAAAERMRKLNADPEFKAKMNALHADPEFKEAAAERMRKLNASRWKPPCGYEDIYRKVAAVLGVKKAREQIETMARNESERAATQTSAR